MTQAPEITVVPIRGARAMIADKMTKSLQGSAQLTLQAQCDMTAVLDHKSAQAKAGVDVSVEDLLIRATALTLLDHPGLNGWVDDRGDSREIKLVHAIHISVAIALPDNLLVAPAIFNAQTMGTKEIGVARHDLIARAKTNKLTVTEMTGGTFTITNLGLSRVQYFTPILNMPQIAVLGVGCVTQQAAPGPDGAVIFRPMAGLSLTFDHRAVNGAPAADFLTALCRMIETFT